MSVFVSARSRPRSSAAAGIAANSVGRPPTPTRLRSRTFRITNSAPSAALRLVPHWSADSAAGEKSVGARTRFTRGAVWRLAVVIASPRAAPRHLPLKSLQGDRVSCQHAVVEAPGVRRAHLQIASVSPVSRFDQALPRFRVVPGANLQLVEQLLHRFRLSYDKSLHAAPPHDAQYRFYRAKRQRAPARTGRSRLRPWAPAISSSATRPARSRRVPS